MPRPICSPLHARCLVAHTVCGTASKDKWWLDATGGHAFSRDGWNWIYTGVAWGCAECRYDTPEGRGALVPFDDATAFRFTRIERPHLIFAGRKLRGDPRYLVVSAQYGHGVDADTRSQNGDASYTLVLPIKASDNRGISKPARQVRLAHQVHDQRKRRKQGSVKPDEQIGEGSSSWTIQNRANGLAVSRSGPLRNLDDVKREKVRKAVCEHCDDAGAFCALSCHDI